MKLLTTIAAVLISVSAYSQDLVEYDNGTFTQNGEQLSLEQIDDLTVLHQAGRGNFRRGNRFDLMYKNPNLRGGNNTLNFIGGAATGYLGGKGILGGGFIIELGGTTGTQSVLLPLGVVVIAGGTGLCVVSYSAFSRIVLKTGCLRKRDNKFNKVADKINQAIADGELSAQASNQ